MQYALLVEAAFLEPIDEPLLKFPLLQVQRSAGSGHRFTPTADELSRVRARLGISGEMSPRPIVLVNPNASDLLPLRKWDGARFIELSTTRSSRPIRMRESW